MDKKALKKAQKEAQRRTSVREFPDHIGASSGPPTKRLRCDNSDLDSPMPVAYSTEDQENNYWGEHGSKQPDEQVVKRVYRSQVPYTEYVSTQN